MPTVGSGVHEPEPRATKVSGWINVTNVTGGYAQRVQAAQITSYRSAEYTTGDGDEAVGTMLLISGGGSLTVAETIDQIDALIAGA